MAWAKFDDGFHVNRKIVPLSDKAFRLYTCSITYVQQQRTGGQLSEHDIRVICSMHRLPPAKTQSELIAAGLWEAEEGGVIIHDWEQYNRLDTGSAARQKAYRDRRKDHNALRNGDGNASRNGDHNALRDVTSQTRARVPDPDPELVIPNSVVPRAPLQTGGQSEATSRVLTAKEIEDIQR